MSVYTYSLHWCILPALLLKLVRLCYFVVLLAILFELIFILFLSFILQ